MNTTARGYDHFKLIVAVILLLIFLCLFLWTPVRAPGVPRQVLTDTGIPPTGTIAPTSTDTSIPSTATVTQEPTPTVTATVTPAPPTPTSTPEPPTQTPMPTATIVEVPTEQSACEMIAPSRLKPGMEAVTKVRLNFRQSAGIGKNLITTMLPETQVEIIGGPTCLKYIRGAYLWWKIKIPGGQIGWSAEASINGGYYFLEPVK